MNQLIVRFLMKTGIFVIVVGLIGCDNLFSPPSNTVERVSDGDTLVVRNTDDQKFTVRFACIDAPEIPHTNKEKKSRKVRDKNQFSWGLKAQKRLTELVKQGNDRVNLDIIDNDQYGRKVAEVRLKDGTFIQQVLLKEGLVKVYRSYLSKCPSKDILQQAESQAKEQKVGVWSDKKFVDPWEYRKLSKSN